MKEKRVLLIALFVLVAVSVTTTLTLAQGPTGTRAGRSPRVALGTGFTYQGQLKNSGAAVNGTCDFQFGLWDSAALGSQVGTTVTVSSVIVTNGLFTAPIDFGASAFNGNARYLGIAVNCGAGLTTLTSRQALTPAPYALYSTNAGNTAQLQGNVVSTTMPSTGQVLKWDGSTWAPGTDAGGTSYTAGFGLTLNGAQFNVVTSTIQQRITGMCASGNALRIISQDGTATCEPIPTNTAGFGLTLNAGQFSVVTSTIQQRVSSTCTSGNAIRVVNQDGTVTCEPIPASFNGWALTGNGGTTYGTNFLGTTDNVTVTLRVSNTVGWRLAPSGTDTPNVIGGYSGNSVTSGVKGATIGGGGESGSLNRVTDDYGVIGGGYYNQAGDNAGTTGDKPSATVGGGYFNTASKDYATVGGGNSNTASGSFATVGGGLENTAGNSAFVGGGQSNSASNYAAIGGGYGNTASGTGAFVGGGGFDGTNTSGNQAVGNASTIGGGLGNSIPVTGTYATVGGGQINTASNQYATVGGGQSNIASNQYTTVGGGYSNTARGLLATISGGESNNASALGDHATISGGGFNTASAQYATVPGGIMATASHYGEMAYASGKFAVNGDAQTSLYVVHNTTTNATPTELFLEGAAQRLTIAPGRTVTFDILVVARRNSNNQSAGYAIRGIIKNDGGTTTIVGGLVKEVLGENDATWDATVVADDIHDALVVQVTGAAATTIGWVASVRTVEVSY